MHMSAVCSRRRWAGAVALAAIFILPGAVMGAPMLPPNLDPGVFRAQLEKMWVRSETFRRQCDRLAAAPHLRVTVGRDLRRVNANHGETTIRRKAGVVVQAFIRVWTFDRVVEVLAHEIEHIIEQLDGVELLDHPAARHVWKNLDGFETRRAMEVGLKVAGEVEYGGASRRPSGEPRP
jgi:hypothetical protein